MINKACDRTLRKILGTAEDAIDALVAKSGGNLELLHTQVGMLNEFAKTYATQGDVASQDRAARKELAIADRLAKADARNAGWQRDLSAAYDRVGDVRVAQGNLAAALASYKDGLAILDGLAKTNPGNADWQRDLSVLYNKVGDVLQAQGNLAERLKSYQDGLDIVGRLARADPGNAGWQRDLSVSYNKVGDVLVAHGNLAETLKSYQDGLAIVDRLARPTPAMPAGSAISRSPTTRSATCSWRKAISPGR